MPVAGADAEARPDDFIEQLVDALPGLLRYARTLAPDLHQAEDLVQDTVVRALDSFGSFQGRSSLPTWLHRIMHILALDAARRRHEVPDDEVDRVTDEVDALWADDRYTVDAAVVIERAEAAELLRTRCCGSR